MVGNALANHKIPILQKILPLIPNLSLNENAVAMHNRIAYALRQIGKMLSAGL